MGQFTGAKSSKMRVVLMQRVKEAGFSVTDAEDLKPGSNKTTIAKMAAALEVDAIVLGKISARNDLNLSVYKPDGRLVAQIKVKGGSSAKLENAIQDEFESTIETPIARAAGGGGVTDAPADEPPAEEPEPEPEQQPPPAEPPPEEPSRAEQPPEEPPEPKEKAPPKATKARAPLELDVGMRGYSRQFEYTDLKGVRDPTSRRTLRPYSLDFAPAVHLGGIFYPGAFFTNGFFGHIGVTGSVDIGFATTTDFEQQVPGTSNKITTELKTTSQAWDVGLRGRIPLGPAEIALFATYGSQSYILHGDEGGAALAPLVPDVKYTFVRLGGEGRVRIAKVLIGAHVAPRILTSLHQIDLPYVWFPGAHGWGLDFGVMLGYGVLPFMDVVLNADFVGYGFDFNPLSTDPVYAPVVAGGATDRYNSLTLGLKFTIGN